MLFDIILTPDSFQLLIDYPDFEYIACMHTFAYTRQNVDQYIKNELGYSDINEFKADEDVYKVLVESGKGSIAQLLASINKRTALIVNTFSIDKKKYEIQVKKTVLNKDNFGIKGTNFNEFYDVLQGLDVKVL